MDATPVEVAWLAGVLEGEGCFHRRSDSGRVVLRVVMCDEDVVAKIAALIGVSYSLNVHAGNRQSENHRDAWQIYTSGEKARAVMRAIRPHMGNRRRAAIDRLLA